MLELSTNPGVRFFGGRSDHVKNKGTRPLFARQLDQAGISIPENGLFIEVSFFIAHIILLPVASLLEHFTFQFETRCMYQNQLCIY
jgi:hypothetical protein